jgi:pimeloyl-ACP methyl ester carboxylesterase
MYSSRNISLESIQKVKVNGETLAYVMFPDESTQYDVRFLLLHGNMGSLFSWREVINGLSQRYVVALDLRGFG